jgi:hypothetical protein
VSGAAKTAQRWRDVRAWTPAIVAAATLGLGYLDLARGGTTLSAILLAGGYLVAVPWAIMKSGSLSSEAR